MDTEVGNRLATLERKVRDGFATAFLTVRGALTAASAAISGAVTAGSLTVGGVAFPVSGTYTPTLTNTTNIDASTAFLAQYLRVGSVVTVSGRVEVDATAAANTVLGISLPIASNFGANSDCCGTMNRGAGGAAEIRANTTADTAEASWTAAVTTNTAYYFTFTYRII